MSSTIIESVALKWLLDVARLGKLKNASFMIIINCKTKELADSTKILDFEDFADVILDLLLEVQVIAE